MQVLKEHFLKGSATGIDSGSNRLVRGKAEDYSMKAGKCYKVANLQLLMLSYT